MTHSPNTIYARVVAASVLWLNITLFTSVHAQEETNYQQSCQKVSISGATLLATCQRLDGPFNRTSILLAGSENIDGRLVYTQPHRFSTFQNSCRHVRNEGNLLAAICRLAGREYTSSSIYIRGLSNINGNLQFRFE